MAPRARRHACTQCNEAYTNPDDLTGHRISEHDAPVLICSQVGCYKTFKSPRTLKRHLKEKHEQQSFSCSYCEFSCARRENVQRHEQLFCRNRPAATASPEDVPVNSRFSSFSSMTSAMTSTGSLPSCNFNEPITPPTTVTTLFERWWESLRLQAINQATALNLRVVDGESERRTMFGLIRNALDQGHIDEPFAEALCSNLVNFASRGLSLSSNPDI